MNVSWLDCLITVAIEKYGSRQKFLYMTALGNLRDFLD